MRFSSLFVVFTIIFIIICISLTIQLKTDRLRLTQLFFWFTLCWASPFPQFHSTFFLFFLTRHFFDLHQSVGPVYGQQFFQSSFPLSHPSSNHPILFYQLLKRMLIFSVFFLLLIFLYHALRERGGAVPKATLNGLYRNYTSFIEACWRNGTLDFNLFFSLGYISGQVFCTMDSSASLLLPPFRKVTLRICGFNW